jgi:hypothetical protein
MPAPGKSKKKKTRKQKLQVVEQQRLIQRLINESKKIKD